MNYRTLYSHLAITRLGVFVLVSLAVLVVLAVTVAACGDTAAQEPEPGTPVVTQGPSTPVRTPVPATPALPSPTPAGTPHVDPPDLTRVINAARTYLVSWLGPVADPSAISLETIEPKTWSGGCFELVRAEQACHKALVPGFRVVFTLGRGTYEVRTDESGSLAAWAPEVQLLARFVESSANVATFETDDGNRLDVQLVPGTSFGLDLAGLEPGTPAGLALVPAPQREGWLLAWVDSTAVASISYAVSPQREGWLLAWVDPAE